VSSLRVQSWLTNNLEEIAGCSIFTNTKRYKTASATRNTGRGENMPTALRMRRVLAAVVLSLISGLSALAQTGTATLSGVIQDPKGGVVPDVEVTATRIETGIAVTTKTNAAGIYVLTGLMPGHYHLLIRRPGFKEIAIKTFELHVQDKLEQNFSLEIGSVSETVTVNANSDQMAPDNPAVGLLVNRDFVENMPLNGRSFQDLLALAPGAIPAAVPGSGNDAFLGLTSFNGQRGDANNFTMDGVSANTNSAGALAPAGDTRGLAGVLPAQTALGTTQSLISIDALQEFKIQTSSYAAESGRQPGGQIELTSRSGTNDFHGSLYDYFRNEALDANGWLFKHYAIPRQPERQNDFGGTIGGPLTIPKLYNGKGKTFFFFSYEGLRLKLPSFGIATVPTAAFRQFAAPGWQPILNSFPIANGPVNGDLCAASLNASDAFSCTAQWTGALSNPSSIDSTSVRVDQFIGQHLQVFVRYANTPSQATTQGAGQNNVTNQNMHSWTVGSTWRVSSNIVDETRFNWTENGGHTLVMPVAIGGSVPFPRTLFVPTDYAPAGAPATVVSVFEFSGPTFSDSLNGPQYGDYFTQVKQYNLVNSLAWTRGSHSFKFGADLRRLQSHYNGGQYDVFLEALSVSSVQQGTADFAASEAGQPGSPTFTNLSLYTQDSWKLTPRLTLDYGLRWEFNPPPGASDGKYPLALTTANIPTAALAPPGTPQYHTRYRNFAPRIGFAYQLNSDQSHPFVVRGGFGVYYDTGQNFGAAGYAGYPFTVSNTFANIPVPAPAGLLAPPSLNFPLVPPYGENGGLRVNDPYLTLPYTEQWNLSISQGLGKRNTFTASYVGNGGRKLLFTQQYGNGSPIAVNPNFASLQLTNNAATSGYNALQVQDQGYVAPGMQLISSYTWAHAIDDASSDEPLYPPMRGNSNYDVRQVFNAALNYQIPSAASKRISRALAHGWGLDARFTAQTGGPIQVIQGTYTLSSGQLGGPISPDLVPGVPLVLRGAAAAGDPFGWALNPAAFALVPLNPDGSPTRQGTLPRNYIHGPGFWNLTLAAQRNFPLTERLHLIFRVDAFNIFNHPNAGAVDSCICDGSTFGQVVGGASAQGVPNSLYATGSARSLQLALKLQF
jgi:hypothetical protein